NRQARCRAANALGAGGDPRAVAPLLRALEDSAADVRAKAAAALGRLRDPAAIPALVAAIGDEKGSVRSAATAALKKFGKKAYQPLLDAYKESSGPARAALLAALARYKTPAVSELLIAALDTPDRAERLCVIRTLGRRKDRRAVEPLLALLAQAKAVLSRVARSWHDGEHQAVASEWSEIFPQLHGVVTALGEIRDERAFAPLQELLESGEPRLLDVLVPDVVRALRSIDNARAVDLLHDMLEEANPGDDQLALALAGMDLMNAAQSLRGTANLGVLLQALGAAGAAHRECMARQADPPADPEGMSRDAT